MWLLSPMNLRINPERLYSDRCESEEALSSPDSVLGFWVEDAGFRVEESGLQVDDIDV